ncbi:MAG: acVLRF1 family peptidyl-tRNA hydrolase [Kineosporiaceae bacterium]
MTARRIDVDAGRLARWVEGFAQRHAGLTSTAWDGDSVRLEAADGALALIDPPFPSEAPLDVEALAAFAARPRCSVVLLARRGGYACAAVDGDRVVASKTGSRYVQARTAAGGWSQQRYARRRANQADGLVDALVTHAVRLKLTDGAQWVVTGGDRPLVEQALADPRLRGLRGLPRGRHLTVGDPSAALVADLPQLLASVQIRLTEP